MAVSMLHVLHQGPVLASLGRTALTALLQSVTGPGTGTPQVPGPLYRETMPPRSPALVAEYLRHVGGEASAYRGALPAHLFPQWSFPLAAKALADLPYPLARVLNGGCRLEMNAPLPNDEPLEVSAQLASVDDDGRRVVLAQEVRTGTASAPDAVVAHMYAIVPLGGGKGAGKKPKAKKKEAARVSPKAEELAQWKLPADAGLSFALLTGDFNPVHWVGPYARLFGFKNVILHGFGTMARAIEGLNRGIFAGASDRLGMIDVQFTRPLVLPKRVGLYVEGDRLWVGDAPGGPAYLSGTWKERS